MSINPWENIKAVNEVSGSSNSTTSQSAAKNQENVSVFGNGYSNNQTNKSNIKTNSFDFSTLDMNKWKDVEPKENRALGFLWSTGGYTYTTSNGVEIMLEDIEDVEILENKETGEVLIVGADGATIKSGSKDATISIYDSEIEKLETGKGNDNLKINNSNVKEISTGKGIDDVSIENSSVKEINTGSGNDTVNISSSSVSKTNTSSTFFGGLFDDSEDTVILKDAEAENIKTGRGNDNIIATDSSVEKIKTGGGDNSLSLNETNVEKLRTNKNDTVVENGNYIDIDKNKILGIESDTQLQISETETIPMSQYTEYLLNQPVGFETEEEYQAYVLQSLTTNLETMKNIFQTQEDSDGIISDGYNALKGLTGLGITDKDIEEMITRQEEMVTGLQAAINGESNMSFEEAYEYYTGVTYSKEKIDKYMEVTNVYSAMMVGCQYDENYIEKFEEATGKSVEDVTKEFALCQNETFGKSTGIQDLVEKYSEDQETFKDNLSAVISTVGIGCIAVGAVVSFFVPPAGAAIMTAGKYISLTGMYVDNAMDLVDNSTDKDGLTKEEAGALLLETGVEVISYKAGQAIGKFTNGLNNTITSKAIANGSSELGSKILGQAAETGADMALSLGADYAIAQGQSIVTTGQFMDSSNYWSMERFLGEGKNQLLGILTGVSSAKVDAYQKSIISVAQGKILSGDPEGAKTVLLDSGMKLDDASFAEFVKQVEINKPQTETLALPEGKIDVDSTETQKVDGAETIKTEEIKSADSTETDIKAPEKIKITEAPKIDSTPKQESIFERKHVLFDKNGNSTEATVQRNGEYLKVVDSNGNILGSARIVEYTPEDVKSIESTKIYDHISEGVISLELVTSGNTDTSGGAISHSYSGVGTLLEAATVQASIDAGYEGRVMLDAIHESQTFHYKNGFRALDEAQNEKIQEAIDNNTRAKMKGSIKMLLDPSNAAELLKQCDIYKKSEFSDEGLSTEVNEQLSMNANQLAQTYAKNMQTVTTEMQDRFANLESVKSENITGRSKSAKSIFEKLASKFIDGKKLKTTELDACKDVIGDAYGTRIQMNSVPKAEADKLIKAAVEGTDVSTDDFIKLLRGEEITFSDDVTKVKMLEQKTIVLTKLKEAQSEGVVKRLIDIIENADAEAPPVITELNNYGSELSSYFTIGQVERIAVAYSKKYGKPLTVVTKLDVSKLPESDYEIKKDDKGNRFIEINKNEALYTDKGSVKDSGYTSSQMNTKHKLSDGSIGNGELQIRGTEVNAFADVEHIPYDIRQGKIKADDPKYAEIYSLIKGMDDDTYKAYNSYLTATYDSLRLTELGIPTTPPKISDYIVSSKFTPDELSLLSREGLSKFH